MKTLRPKVFKSTQLQNIEDEINQNGYVVVNITDTLNPIEVQQLFIQDVNKIQLPDKDTLTSRDLWNLQYNNQLPYSRMEGLTGEYGLTQGEACWKVRTNEEIQKIFAYLNGTDTDGIVCSMDAIGYSPDSAGCSEEMWLHTDQNILCDPQSSGSWRSFQGIYYAETVNDTHNSAGTVVVPGSHLVTSNTDAAAGRHGQKSHFQLVENEKYIGQAYKLLIHAGELLIFNSRLIHQGWYGNHRLCFMVSYGLKSDRSDAVRNNKILMYLTGQRTSHWSQLGIAHGYKYPESYHTTSLCSEHVQKFQCLQPRLTANVNLKDVEYLYFKYLIPSDRLRLL